jgi:hypothetical protein
MRRAGDGRRIQWRGAAGDPPRVGGTSFRRENLRDLGVRSTTHKRTRKWRGLEAPRGSGEPPHTDWGPTHNAAKKARKER